MAQSTAKIKATIASIPTRMSRTEKFNFALALIGLVADTIGIGTFLFAFGNLDAGSGSKQPFALLVFLSILSASILIYGWFGIAWFIVRRYYKLKMKTHPENIENLMGEMCFRASILAALLTLPGILMWVCLVCGNPSAIILGLFIVGIGWFGIAFGIYFFMPVIYEDMLPIMEENPFFSK